MRLEDSQVLRQMTDELGMQVSQLRTWQQERRPARSGAALAGQKAEAPELVRVRREVKRLGPEHKIPKCAATSFAWRAVPP